MSIELTAEQQQALHTEQNGQQRVVDPKTKMTYILVPENEYQAMQDILKDERHQQAIHTVGLRNAAGRLLDDDV